MNRPLTILLTGPTGQIGLALKERLERIHELVALDRNALDLANLAEVDAAVGGIAPDVIINAAGYTAVDDAEHQPELAERLNVEAPRTLAEAACRCGAVMVHFSTDYVFAGTATHPYEPTDPTDPQSVYGRTKLAGEIAVRESGTVSLVLRTSWIYDARGRNFLRTMLRLAERHREIRVVDDQIGSPTAAHVIADATIAALDRKLDGRRDARGLGGHEGVYHVTCSGRTSWFGFAGAIFELVGRRPTPVLVPIATSAYPTPARRPAFSVLSSARFESVFGFSMPPWRDALTEVVRELQANAPMPSREAGP